MSNKKIRQSNFELLRIFAIMSVIVLHYFNGGIGGGMNCVHGTWSNLIAHLFLTLSFCAVDLFIMISGYFLSASSKRSFSKIFFLLFEAFILRTAQYIITALTTSQSITFSGILSCFFSIGYFIMFYSIIYLISPLINLMFTDNDGSRNRKILVLLFIFFSVIPSVASLLDSLGITDFSWTAGLCTVTKEGSFEGYSIVNFFLCYVLGGYIRHYHSDKKSFTKLFIIFSVNTILLLIWGYFDWYSAFTYDNPLVIFEGASLILLFNNFSFKSKVVNELSSSGFTCYLVHGVFLKYIQIEKYASGEWYVLLIHVILSVSLIYLICYVIHKIYTLCTGWIVKYVSPIIDKNKLFNIQ